MYHLKLTTRAKRDLKNLKNLYLLPISTVLDEIREDPFNGKPLSRELTGKFSFKVGQYRIIYKIDKKDKAILVLTIGHRSKIYS